MPDFRVADTASEHPKMRAAGLAAVGLWTAGGSYAMNPAHMTDGWVPLHYVQTWPSGKKLAARLIEVGLWREETRNGQPGYRFHEWDEIQRSASSVEDEKRKARDRMARIRSANVRPNKPRTNGERSPNVHDSLTLTPSGSVGGLSPVGRYARGNEYPPPKKVPPGKTRPADRCPDHAGLDRDPGPCRACGDARRAAETWDRQHHLDERLTIRACGLCDGDGYRLEPGRRIPVTPYVRCDHHTRTERP